MKLFEHVMSWERRYIREWICFNLISIRRIMRHVAVLLFFVAAGRAVTFSRRASQGRFNLLTLELWTDKDATKWYISISDIHGSQHFKLKYMFQTIPIFLLLKFLLRSHLAYNTRLVKHVHECCLRVLQYYKMRLRSFMGLSHFYIEITYLWNGIQL